MTLFSIRKTAVPILLLLVQLFTVQTSRGEGLPSPRIENLLFFLQRTPGANMVIYELNLNEDGTLCTKAPVKASWIRETAQGEFKEIKSIENKYTYGVYSHYLGNDEYEIHFTAYQKLSLYLRRSEIDNKYKIYIKDEGMSYLLKRIFIMINRGSLRFPKLQYIDLIAVDTINGKEILRRINI